MCGALASQYNAQLIKEIDRRITNKHIVIAGGAPGQLLEKKTLSSGAEDDLVHDGDVPA